MRRKASASLLALMTCVLVAAAQPAEPPAASPQRLPSAARLANAAEVRKRLGLAAEYQGVSGIESLKIAVLDYGFDGVDGVRPYLPKRATVVEHYDKEFIRGNHLGDPDFQKPFDPGNRHGRTMAQIVWAVTGFHAEGPQFYLLNANGPTMLRRAVRYAIEQKVDIILFSGAFEGGGNGDGRGPINRVVADALAADILWINAAGNYGRRVYNGPVRIGPDGYLRFREDNDGTALRFRNRLDENTVTVTLTWNDYRDQEDAGTEKDLDLYIEDWNGQRIGASEKTQVAGTAALGPDDSRNPRERVVLTDLPANLDMNYRIRVKARKHNFTADDRIRVLIASRRDVWVSPETNTPDDAVKFFDATGKGELYPPADNPLVLTVGDATAASSIGPTADHRVKPDVILEDSRAFFSDGEVSAGSSNAAAYFTGVIAVLKVAEPRLRARHLLRLAQQDTATSRAIAARDSRSLTGTMPPPSDLSRPDVRVSRYAQPSVATPQSSGGTRVVISGPLGRTLVIQPRSSSGAGSSATLLPRGMMPAPSRSSPSGSETGSALAGRVWRTPSRAQLAATIRDER